MEPFLLKNGFRNTSAIPTTPSAPLRWLRAFFLMAQPPLLCQEGRRQPDIHSHLRQPDIHSQHRGFRCAKPIGGEKSRETHPATTQFSFVLRFPAEFTCVSAALTIAPWQSPTLK